MAVPFFGILRDLLGLFGDSLRVCARCQTWDSLPLKAIGWDSLKVYARFRTWFWFIVVGFVVIGGDWMGLDGIGWGSLKVYARYRTLFWFVVGDLLGLDGLDGIIWESLGSSGIV